MSVHMKIFCRILAGLALCLAVGVGAEGASVSTPPPCYNAVNCAAKLNANKQAPITYAQQPHVICSGTSTGAEGAFSGNLQTAIRRVFYCPLGASEIGLALESWYVASTVETDDSVPILQNLTVEIVCAPWNSATAYITGNCVSWSYGQWTATGNNTNSMPTASNSNWSVFAGNTRVNITCNGQRTCGLPTQSQAGSGAARPSRSPMALLISSRSISQLVRLSRSMPIMSRLRRRKSPTPRWRISSFRNAASAPPASEIVRRVGFSRSQTVRTASHPISRGSSVFLQPARMMGRTGASLATASVLA